MNKTTFLFIVCTFFFSTCIPKLDKNSIEYIAKWNLYKMLLYKQQEHFQVESCKAMKYNFVNFICGNPKFNTKASPYQVFQSTIKSYLLLGLEVSKYEEKNDTVIVHFDMIYDNWCIRPRCGSVPDRVAIFENTVVYFSDGEYQLFPSILVSNSDFLEQIDNSLFVNKWLLKNK